jgi:hypothetical protein
MTTSGIHQQSTQSNLSTGNEQYIASGSAGSSSGQEAQTTGNQSQQGTTPLTPASPNSTTHTPETSNSEGGTSSLPGGNNTCSSEGFFPTPGDCRKFHRCVGNGKGGFTKYDFKCGDGTLWDPAQDVCNHEYAVRRDCNASGKPGNEAESTGGEQTSQPGVAQNNSTTSTVPDEGATAPSTGGNQGISTSTTGGGSGASTPGIEDIMTTTNGQGSSGKPEYVQSTSTDMSIAQQGSTASGDQEMSSTSVDGQSILTSPSNGQEVSTTPTNTLSSSTAPGEGEESSAAPIASQEVSTSGQGSSNTSESESHGNTETAPCNQQTTRKPSTVQIKCEKAGYYPHPTDCKKFYRCVDWDGDMGKRFSVYYFDCPEGTIFDPSLSVCNHAESVYPPRDCNGNSTIFSEKPTSTPQTTLGTKPAEITSGESSSETPTATTDAGTSEQTLGTPVSTTEGETTTVTPTGAAETTITSQATTNTNGETETPIGTTNQETTGTSGSTTDSPTSSISQETSSTAGTTTEEATTSTNEETAGNVGSTDLATTLGSTEQTTNPAETTNTEATNPTEETGNTSGTTGGSEQSSTESAGTTSTPEVGSSTESLEENNTTGSTVPAAGGGGQCPTVGELDKDQIVVVCPTGFRRHPKYCNLFYQCTTSGHEMKILVLACTNNTVFDDQKIQCLPPQEAAPCQGRMAKERFNRRVGGSSNSLPVSQVLYV